MTDPKKESEKEKETDPKATPEGNAPPKGEEDGEGKDKELAELKAKRDGVGFGLRQAQKINADQEAKIKILEEKLADPKDDGERLAALEVELARSKAVSRFGLTEDQADRLKGTPAEILDDAKYWSEQKSSTDKPGEPEPSNREMIDSEVNPSGNGQRKDATPKSPEPKKDANKGSWIERYKAANPGERYKMDEDVKNGIVNPHA